MHAEFCWEASRKSACGILQKTAAELLHIWQPIFCMQSSTEIAPDFCMQNSAEISAEILHAEFMRFRPKVCMQNYAVNSTCITPHPCPRNLLCMQNSADMSIVPMCGWYFTCRILQRFPPDWRMQSSAKSSAEFAYACIDLLRFRLNLWMHAFTKISEKNLHA